MITAVPSSRGNPSLSSQSAKRTMRPQRLANITSPEISAAGAFPGSSAAMKPRMGKNFPSEAMVRPSLWRVSPM